MLLFVFLVLMLLFVLTRIDAQLYIDSINYEGSTGHASQPSFLIRSRHFNLDSHEKFIIKSLRRMNSFTEAMPDSVPGFNILTGRDSIRSSHFFPTTVNKECVNKTISTDFEDCKRKVQLRNGKFAVMVSLVGLAFLLLLGFTISGHMRREKARRLTLLHGAGGDMSQQTSEVATPTLKRLVDDPEIGRTDAVGNNPIEDIRSMQGEGVRPKANVQMVPATFDGASDGWDIWLRENRENLSRPTQPPPRPRIPTLKLPKLTLGTFHRVFGDLDFGTRGEKLHSEQDKGVKGPSRLRWGSTA